MIQIDLSIANPFKHAEWKSLYQRDRIISKNKTLEIGFFRYAYNLVELSLDLKWRGRDHAGPSIEIGLFGWQARFAIIDHRHWDHKNNKWQEYNTD